MSSKGQVKRGTGWQFALAGALVLGALAPQPCGAAPPERASQKCRRQLQLLAEALGSYRQEHSGVFPVRLGELWPGYLSDRSLLRCPAALEYGKAGTFNPDLLDPSGPDGRVVGYTWEMSSEDPESWDRTGFGMSFATFKNYQLQSLVGKYVPVIRCSHHGEGHVLNVTVDGSVYESGEYWECNFVDQLSGIRLGPGLVKQADRPISALVQPRPPWATEAMVDLRHWYNARLEDPWVNDEPRKEQLQPDPELSRGVITNRGVAFDAAGVIQLSGRLEKKGDWDAFARLLYPRAVKSMNIKRSFRVMHVLGAVQFQDPPGTKVARIEIHRTGVPPENWDWFYGDDVLNYRFVPGSSEDRLKSSVIAWTGKFAHPEAQEQRPRLFHLRYPTDKPEAVVDHVDFFAGEGVSSPFIVAITLE